MQTADEHKKEEKLKRILKEYPLEQPHTDFTERLMDKVENEVAVSSLSRYSPLISLRAAVVIAVLGALFLILASQLEFSQSFLSLQVLDSVTVEWQAWNELREKISTSIMIYVMIFLIVGLGIQFHQLKRWHTRQIYS